MAKSSSRIGTVIACPTWVMGDCTLLVSFDGIEETVTAEAVASEGWFPDKDDLVRIFESGSITMVEPVGWEEKMKDSDKLKIAKERIDVRAKEVEKMNEIAAQQDKEAVKNNAAEKKRNDDLKALDKKSAK